RVIGIELPPATREAGVCRGEANGTADFVVHRHTCEAGCPYIPRLLLPMSIFVIPTEATLSRGRGFCIGGRASSDTSQPVAGVTRSGRLFCETHQTSGSEITETIFRPA